MKRASTATSSSRWKRASSSASSTSATALRCTSRLQHQRLDFGDDCARAHALPRPGGVRENAQRGRNSLRQALRADHRPGLAAAAMHDIRAKHRELGLRAERVDMVLLQPALERVPRLRPRLRERRAKARFVEPLCRELWLQAKLA